MKLNIHIPYDPTFPLIVVYSAKVWMHVNQKLHKKKKSPTTVFVEVLDEKVPKSPSA